MRRNAMCSLVLAAGVFLIASAISAHHGVAHYDMKKTIALTGTITAFDWGNPHCLVHMDVMDDTGHFRHWTLEMSSTSAMSRRGWAKDTLKRGDQVIVETHPAQNGTPLGITSSPDFALKFVVNGREVTSR
jgi:Family of unknown function (DUF6152)